MPPPLPRSQPPPSFATSRRRGALATPWGFWKLRLGGGGGEGSETGKGIGGWGPVSEAVRDLDTDRTDTLAPLGGWSVRVRCGAAGGELEAHAYTWGPRVVGPSCHRLLREAGPTASDDHHQQATAAA
uniref:Uncharacterized protein n=1 Tax=Oryza glumipatula TaxID=40148 RepID=A0A0D9Y5Y5_9ORYZ